MKAIVQATYGSPENLVLEEIDEPEVKDGEVRVRVHAASLHIGDWHLMRGKPVAMRLMMGFLGPKHRPGSDVAGEIEAVGANVDTFKPGDPVFGWCHGAFAEYVCASAENFAPKPDNLSWDEAAAIGVSAFTALHAVRDQAKIQPGQKVLVNGASGGVGTFVVQIAKAFGAEVTGVCSTRNVEMVASFGASNVIDYTREDFMQTDQRYDFILDVAGSRSFGECRRVLAPNGLVIPIGGPASLIRVFKILLHSLFARQLAAPFVSMPNHEDLLALRELAAAGKIKPAIDRRYPLYETPQAFGYIGQGHARGKIVIQIPG